MRTVVSGLFVALDGVAEAPNHWQFEFDAEMAASLGEQIARADAVLLGRVTYQKWGHFTRGGLDRDVPLTLGAYPTSWHRDVAGRSAGLGGMKPWIFPSMPASSVPTATAAARPMSSSTRAGAGSRISSLRSGAGCTSPAWCRSTW